MSATITTTAVNGSKLLEACGYDRRLAAIVICAQPDSEQKELLDSITPALRRNVAAAVAEIKEALGQDSGYAREIAHSFP